MEQVATAEMELMTIAGLDESLRAMRESGVPTTTVLAGPLTYEFLIETELHVLRSKRPFHMNGNEYLEAAEIASEEAMRRQLLKGAVAMEFRGCRITRCTDVPEGKLWPA